MRRAIALLIALAGLIAGAPANAQFVQRVVAPGPPSGTPAAEADIWPFPPPDPKSWWDEKRPKATEAADPLGGRRLPRGRRLPAIDNGVDAATYRLWGLMPLQWQLLRNGEMVLEIWIRPSKNVRQSIVRVTVRGDGRAFVQGRAGFACCEAGIGRRIGFDDELPAGQAQAFLALRNDPMWRAPREVEAVRDAGAAEVVCVQGVGYDLTLLTTEGARSLHRACDPIAVGQAAPALEMALKAALGHETRFDVLYPGGASFAAERQAFETFTAEGGALQPSRVARTEPPGAEPAPQPE